VSCRDAYKATDVRNKQVKTGLSLAMAQHRQMLTDVAMADPVNNLADAIILEQHSAPVQLLNLAAHESWAATSPLVRKTLLFGPIPDYCQSIIRQKCRRFSLCAGMFALFCAVTTGACRCIHCR
jgi:hypothetical protein